MNDILTAIGNLLAVIHRDGGHYEAQHGIVKACSIAELIITNERRALEDMTTERNALYSRISELSK